MTRGASGAARPAAVPTPPADEWRWEPTAAGEPDATFVAAWQKLADATPSPAFAGPAFVLALRAAFVRPPARLALHALYQNGELVAVVPLLRRTGLVPGWATLTNDHAPGGAVALRSDAPAVARHVVDRLLATGDRLSLPGLPHDGPVWRALTDAAHGAGLPVLGRASVAADTWLALPASRGALEEAMPPRLARDVHGKLRRLERAGRVRFERVERGPAVADALDECFALEARSWKAFSGTPVRRDPAAHAFYVELARRASLAGQLALYLLRVDGRLIAFRYCLRAGTRLDSLKTSFAPEWARYSPGLLTQFLAAVHEIDDGTTRTMHFGAPSAHKLRWATGVAPLATLEIYSRRARGRLALWPPRLHARLVALPGMRQVVPRWRAIGRRLRDTRHDARVRVGKLLLRPLAGRMS